MKNLKLLKNINISKAYTIYTGNSIKSLILRYVAIDILIGAFAFLLIHNSPFLIIKNALMVSVLFISALSFSIMQTGVLINATKADCYLHTIKQRRKIYLTLYFTTYFTMIVALMILLVTIYLASAICNTLIENASLIFLLDMECLLLYFAVLPFIFKSKSLMGVSPKNLLLFIGYVLICTVIILKPLWIEAILLLLIVPSIGVWSNKRWIKSISEVL